MYQAIVFLRSLAPRRRHQRAARCSCAASGRLAAMEPRTTRPSHGPHTGGVRPPCMRSASPRLLAHEEDLTLGNLRRQASRAAELVTRCSFRCPRSSPGSRLARRLAPSGFAGKSCSPGSIRAKLKVDWSHRVDTLTAVMLVWGSTPCVLRAPLTPGATWKRDPTGRASLRNLSLFKRFRDAALLTAEILVQRCSFRLGRASPCELSAVRLLVPRPSATACRHQTLFWSIAWAISASSSASSRWS